MIRFERTTQIFLGTLFVINGLFASTTFAAVMQSSNYKIDADSVNVGGTENSSSANYKVSDTAGETGAGLIEGLVYKIKAGYRQMVAVVTSSSGSGGSSSSGTSAGGGPVSGSGGLSAFVIQSVKTAVGVDVALIELVLNRPGKVKFAWGLSNNYEGGVSNSDVFRLNHVFKLEGLLPSQKYYFKVEALDEGATQAGLVNQSLKTLSAPDQIPPSNALNFGAKAGERAINLSWNNPKDQDIEFVRVVRSESFYPTDPSDGKLLFEGRSETAIDQNVNPGQTYYYTLFVKDISGNYSSGAITSGRVGKAGEPDRAVSEDYLSNLPKSTQVSPEITRLSFLDFDISQDGRKVFEKDGTLVLDGGSQFKISIGYDKLSEVLKTMAVSIRDKADPKKVFSFLLRVNQNKSAYEASIDAFDRSGSFAVNISILDHKNQALKQIESNWVVTPPRDLPSFVKWFKEGITSRNPIVIGSSLSILFILILIVRRFFLRVP